MITIVIQAGGQSSRMGQDKALMPFLGQTLIEREIERVSLLAGELLITTNHPQDYAFLGRPLFPDVLPGLGALGGLYTALYAATLPVVAVLACDMPFINPRLIAAQRDLLEAEGADVVIPRTEQGMEPLHAVYRREPCLRAVRAALGLGERRMIAWLPQVNARIMEPQEIAAYDPHFYSFINVNSPEEHRAAESLAQKLDAA